MEHGKGVERDWKCINGLDKAWSFPIFFSVFCNAMPCILKRERDDVAASWGENSAHDR